MPHPTVHRSSLELLPDARRVLAQPHLPSEGPGAVGQPRLERLVAAVLALGDEEVAGLLADTRRRFADRHEDLEAVLDRHAGAADHLVAARPPLARERRLLLGAYLTKEYSVEGASLSNPSIVAGPDQDGLGAGELRAVLSLRSIGEGHLSSVQFRSVVLRADGDIDLDPVSPLAVPGERTWPDYDRRHFAAKLDELGADPELVAIVLGTLPDPFSMTDLELARMALDEQVSKAVAHQTANMVLWLARSNYVSTFAEHTELSERVLFPEGPHESRGMEDARFVRFVDTDRPGGDGEVTYYATYTAYDGFQILPQLLLTPDFCCFDIQTLSGRGAQNKGMALFPRRVGGQFVALSRIGGEDISIMRSPEVRTWERATTLKRPERSWELFQMGNCGSPLETEAGWVVLTHGVGPMRRYCLGALLLDLEEPERVLGASVEPILEPEDDERDGYVPNVVYSCGGIVHDGHLVLPYGYSDVGARVARFSVDELLASLTTTAARV